MTMNKKISICTTNYNCAHALNRHLDSIYSQLDEKDFEYIMVDNFSKDASPKILKEFEKKHDNFKLLSHKSSMGKGREIAFGHSHYDHIMVVDTDTVYFPIFKDFIEIYFNKYSNIALQALYCGIFPRDIWEKIGGRRDFNIYEDVDMWIRIWRLGKIKWYPVIIGENIKDSDASWEYKSTRYGKMEKVRRLLKREYDLFRLREIHNMNLKKMYEDNIVDLGIGEMQPVWVKNVPKQGFISLNKSRARALYNILKG
jgi:glycosyltransferase involved in cell wall biosynthesis